MKVLVTGANGFIGAHVVSALAEAGFSVVRAVRSPDGYGVPSGDIRNVAVDFNADTVPAAWMPRLAGADAVVNCAGILQRRRGQDMRAIHVDAPIALFQACESAGIRRVIQVSAMGTGADTEFARTKHACDQHLSTLDLDWIILKPSLVFAEGSYGGTSLLRGLAGLPGYVPLIGDGRQVFRPIHARDLANGVVSLLKQADIRQVTLEPAGPQELTLREILLCYRHWLGFGEARFMPVPLPLVRLVAKLGDWFGNGPVNSTALRQLEYGNSTASNAFTEATGLAPASLSQWLARFPSRVQDRWHARLYWLVPWIRLTLGAIWLWLGTVLGISGLEANGSPETASGWLAALAGLLMATTGIWVQLRPGNSPMAWALAVTIALVFLGVAQGAYTLPGVSMAGVAVLFFGMAPLIVVYAILSNPR